MPGVFIYDSPEEPEKKQEEKPVAKAAPVAPKEETPKETKAKDVRPVQSRWARKLKRE